MSIDAGSPMSGRPERGASTGARSPKSHPPEPHPNNPAAGVCYRWQGADLLLQLRVQPRASRAGLGEPVGDALKVHLQSPPVDGAANAELVGLLAKAFGVGRAAVTIASGHRGRSKQVRIAGPVRLPPPILRG